MSGNTNAPDNGRFQRWPRSQGHIFLYQWKDPVTKNDHVQYLYFKSYDQCQFKKKKWPNGQKVSINRKILSKGIQM